MAVTRVGGRLLGSRILYSSFFNYATKMQAVMANAQATRHVSTLKLSKNLELFSMDKIKAVNLKLLRAQDKPLVVLLGWMLAKRKHIFKFVDYYTERGFDVLSVTISPWQLLWPAKGSQVVAKEVVTFLEINKSYTPLLVHGFSVGGYQWGEVLVQIASNPEQYGHIADKIAGQVWDSAADISEVWFGFPMAVFPTNQTLQNAMKQYMLYHMRTFDKVATCHYCKSSQMFHSNLVKAPALLLFSKVDPVGAEVSNQRLRGDWEKQGIEVSWKCWDDSPHVGHFHYHQQEYLRLLEQFLSDIDLGENVNKVQAKL